MNAKEALASIGKIVTFWDENKDQYVEAKLRSYEPDVMFAYVVPVGRSISCAVDIKHIHLGTKEEVDAYENSVITDIEAEVDSLKDEMEGLGIDPAELDNEEER